MDTPRSARRFTVDSYNGRHGNIPKFHRLNTLTQNVDTLDLRDGTILTPNDYEVITAHVHLSLFAQTSGVDICSLLKPSIGHFNL